jgi:hypothetical protein
MSINAKLNPRHQQLIRDKIQAGLLVERLTECALGSLELSAQQMRAIEILLKKSVPDLSSVELTGDADAPVLLKVITGVPTPLLENKQDG